MRSAGCEGIDVSPGHKYIFRDLAKARNCIAARNIFAANSSNDLFMTDFSLHSIGVFLFQRNRHDVYDRFVKDIVIDAGISVIGLDSEDVLDLSRISSVTVPN